MDRSSLSTATFTGGYILFSARPSKKNELLYVSIFQTYLYFFKRAQNIKITLSTHEQALPHEL